MSKTSRVLQVNTADIRGGAEKVALDLHRTYRARGVDAHLAVGHQLGDAPGVVCIPNEAERGSWARTLGRLGSGVAGGPHPEGLRRVASRALLLASEPSRYMAIAAGVEDFDYPATAGLLDVAGPRPDVLHLHNLHGYYFDLRALPRLSSCQPTILTMHDAWPLTGHCAHPIDCPRWRVGCGECPDLNRYVPIRRDASARSFEIKRAALGASALSYATPSQWLMRMAEASGLLGENAQTRVIPNGVDTTIFSPGDRGEARRELELPLDREIIMFAAHGGSANPYKDYPTLLKALPSVAEKRGGRLLLVALGDAVASTDVSGVETRSLPFVNDAGRLALYYRAADLYVHPARAENLPLAIIEAMACGTPVVSTEVGGIPEIVEDGATGTLLAIGDSAGLASAIVDLLADKEKRRAFSEAGIRRVLDRFTLERQAAEYLAWYEAITSH